MGFNYTESYITYIDEEIEMPEILHRKIQKTGGTTYIVSLPKKWVEKQNLKEGDFITLIVNPREIILTTRDKGEEELRVEIKVSDRDPRLIERLIISHYLAGYDVVKIMSEKLSEEYRSHIKKVIKKKLIGFEVVDEDINVIEIRSLVKEKELSVDLAISRMFKIGSFLLGILPDVILNLDEVNAKLMIQNDDDVDRLYLYTIRMIRKTKNRDVDIGRLLILAMMSKALERIVDHIVRIAYTVTEMRKISDRSILERIYNLLHITNEIYISTYNAYIHGDLNLSNEVISRVKDAVKKFDHIVNELREDQTLSREEIINLNTILESGKRICEYSADIGEMIIDLNTVRMITL